MQKEAQIKLALTRSADVEEETNLQEVIDILEKSILDCQEAANRGEELVSDAIYDVLIERLRQLDPSNQLLYRVWSEDESELDPTIDKMLEQYPMKSIQTVKEYTSKVYTDYVKYFRKYYTSLRMIVSVKLNGHGGRAIIQKGNLIKGTSRGRATNGKDITSQVGNIIGTYFPQLEHLDHVELRFEVLLPFENLEKARVYNSTIKSAFTGVSSMLRASASKEENQLLKIVVYDILSDDLHFDYLSDKYEYIKSLGLEVPLYMCETVNANELTEFVKDTLLKFEVMTEDYQYFLDGLVVSVDSIEVFKEFGEEESFRLGNIALKLGKWEQNGYSGVIDRIIWEGGKSRLTPVALLEGDGVPTASGSSVRRVPLYAPYNILLLEAYPQNVIHFKYGGEAGVVPTTPDGKLLKEIEKVKNPTQENFTQQVVGYVAEVDGHTFYMEDEDFEDEELDESVFS